MLVVCGSATTWITNKILSDKGGLFNRAARRLYLMPFTLQETERYLLSRGIHWSRYDIVECYMTMGGIPYYLKLLDNELSYLANIDAIFFKRNGALWDEFDHLYQTLFSNSPQYIKTVETLSGKRGGMTRTELAQRAGMHDNGSLTEVLDNLSVSDFIRPYSYYGRKTHETRYRVSDYYSLFYFRFLKEYYGRDEQYWSHSSDNPSRRAWEGLTFELLCMDHIPQIKQKLGISGVLSDESTWFLKGGEGAEKGAQIDLLIDRRDHVINICEIKFAMKEYEINKQYEELLRNKMEAFRSTTGTKKTLQLTMITTYGIKMNKYSNRVSNQVLLDDLFAG